MAAPNSTTPPRRRPNPPTASESGSSSDSTPARPSTGVSFPWLMLSEPTPTTYFPVAKAPRCFYDIPARKAREYSVPGEDFYRCVASAHGWIILTDLQPPHWIVLLNPITQRRIEISRLPDEDRKINRLHAVLTSSPLEPECILAVASDGTISYCRPCPNPEDPDSQWRRWNTAFVPGFLYDAAASDALVVGAMLYLVDEGRSLWRFDLTYQNPKLSIDRECTEFQLPDGEKTRHYLVESLGFVHLVLSDDHHKRVRIYRMDWGDMVWTQVTVDSLGRDRVLLLGRGCSAAVPSSAAGRVVPGSALFARQPSVSIGAAEVPVWLGFWPSSRTSLREAALGHTWFWAESRLGHTGPGDLPVTRMAPQHRRGQFKAADSFWFFPDIDPDEGSSLATAIRLD